MTIQNDLIRCVYYLEKYGYVSYVVSDYGEVNIYYLGKTINEAFIRLIIRYEIIKGHTNELLNRTQLEKDFKEKYPNLEYFGNLETANYALNNIKKYYDGIIPIEILEYFKNWINCIHKCDGYTWVFKDNKFVLEKAKNLVLSK